jgi:hypothetical protein
LHRNVCDLETSTVPIWAVALQMKPGVCVCVCVIFNLSQGQLCVYLYTTEKVVIVGYIFSLALVDSISFDGYPSGRVV